MFINIELIYLDKTISKDNNLGGLRQVSLSGSLILFFYNL